MERAIRIRAHEIRISEIIERRRMEGTQRAGLERDARGVPPALELPDPKALARLRRDRIAAIRAALRREEAALEPPRPATPIATPTPSVPAAVRVSGQDMEIEAVAALIAKQIAQKVFIYGEAAGQRVSVEADGAPVEEVLGRIATSKGWAWWRELNGDYGIGDKTFYERNVLPARVVQQIFRAGTRKPSELEPIAKGLLTPNIGSIIADDISGKVILADLPEVIARIREAIPDLVESPALVVQPAPLSREMIRLRHERIATIRRALREEEAALALIGPAADEDTTGTIPQPPPPVLAKVEVAGTDTNIETVVAIINRQIPNKVNIYGRATGQRVTVLADRLPVEDVLSSIANSRGWIWWKENSGDYGLADKQYYQEVILASMVKQAVFQPGNRKASELDPIVQGLLTPNIGTSKADDVSGILIVTDLPAALERIEGIVAEIAPPRPPRAGMTQPPMVEVDADRLKLHNVLQMINMQTREKVTFRGRTLPVERAIVVPRERQPLEELLSTIADDNGLLWWKEPEGGYSMGRRPDYLASLGIPRTVVPLPEAEAEPPTITLDFCEAKIAVVLASLNRQLPGRVVITFGEATGSRIDVQVENVPLAEALDAITKPHGWTWWREPTRNYAIADEGYYKYEVAYWEGQPPPGWAPGPVIQDLETSATVYGDAAARTRLIDYWARTHASDREIEETMRRRSRMIRKSPRKP